VRRVGDLKILALLFGPALVVGHLRDEPGDLGPELIDDLLDLHTLVFDRVVQQGCNHDVGVAISGFGRQAGNLDQVIHVGLGAVAFPPLVDVLASCKIGRSHDLYDVVHSVLRWMTFSKR